MYCMVNEEEPNQPLKVVNQTILEVLTPSQKEDRDNLAQIRADQNTTMEVLEGMLKELKSMRILLDAMAD